MPEACGEFSFLWTFFFLDTVVLIPCRIRLSTDLLRVAGLAALLPVTFRFSRSNLGGVTA